MTDLEPRSILTALLLTAALAAVAPGVIAAEESESNATTVEDIRHELADTGEAIAAYSAEQRDEAVAEAESALATLDASIERSQAWVDKNWDEMSEAAREKARSAMVNLREQRNEVAEWLGGLKHSSAEAWDDVKDGFAGAWSQLQMSWSQAQEEFDSEQ